MKKYGQWEIAVRSLECHRRFQHEAHHHFSWLDMIWMTSQESGFSENIRTAIGLLRWSRYIFFFFVSLLKSILIIVKIISIPLQVDRALKSRKMCNFENLFLHCLSQRHCIVNIFPTLFIALLIFLFLEHCKYPL